MKSISIPELHETYKNKKDKHLILDVRTPDEYAEGHVPGAMNIPHDEVSNHAEKLKEFLEIHIYCRAGRRAEYAAQMLKDKGITTISCVSDGGFPDWERNGFDVE